MYLIETICEKDNEKETLNCFIAFLFQLVHHHTNTTGNSILLFPDYIFQLVSLNHTSVILESKLSIPKITVC